MNHHLDTALARAPVPDVQGVVVVAAWTRLPAPSAALAAAAGRDRHRSSGPRRREFAMTWPTVTELPGRLEAVSKDTFIDGL
jgi:hypothetical protein